MKYTIFRTSSFKSGFKKISAKDQSKVLSVVEMLANGETLGSKYYNVPIKKNHFKENLYTSMIKFNKFKEEN